MGSQHTYTLQQVLNEPLMHLGDQLKATTTAVGNALPIHTARLMSGPENWKEAALSPCLLAGFAQLPTYSANAWRSQRRGILALQ